MPASRRGKDSKPARERPGDESKNEVLDRRAEPREGALPRPPDSSGFEPGTPRLGVGTGFSSDLGSPIDVFGGPQRGIRSRRARATEAPQPGVKGTRTKARRGPLTLEFMRAPRTIIVVSSDGTPPRKVPAFPRTAATGKEQVEVAVGRGDKLVLNGPLTDFTAALRALVPSPKLMEQLEEEADLSGLGWSDLEDADPIDTGNTINGEAWGWVQGTERWYLLPADFQSEAVVLSKAFGSMESSMTGGFTSATVKFTPTAALYSLADDNEGHLTFDVTYNPDPKRVARRPFVDVLEGRFDDPWCPLCEDNEWVIRLAVNPDLAPGVEQRAWRSVYRLCKKHRANPTFEDGEGTLTLIDGRWVAQ